MKPTATRKSPAISDAPKLTQADFDRAFLRVQPYDVSTREKLPQSQNPLFPPALE
jgi:hypothetical protein